jgi:hypothetical protein
MISVGSCFEVFQISAMVWVRKFLSKLYEPASFPGAAVDGSTCPSTREIDSQLKVLTMGSLAACFQSACLTE